MVLFKIANETPGISRSDPAELGSLIIYMKYASIAVGLTVIACG